MRRWLPWSIVAVVIAVLVLFFTLTSAVPKPSFQFLRGHTPMQTSLHVGAADYLYAFQGDFEAVKTAAKRELEALGLVATSSAQPHPVVSFESALEAEFLRVTIYRDAKGKYMRAHARQLPLGMGSVVEKRKGWVTVHVEVSVPPSLWDRFKRSVGL